MIDFIIVVVYFILIFLIAISGRVKSKSAEEYFLSNRYMVEYNFKNILASKQCAITRKYAVLLKNLYYKS